jgi:hypothetical protein
MNLEVLIDRRTVARTAGDKTSLTTQPLCLPAYDRPIGRPKLICHWHRDEQGQLACRWEPDVPPNSYGVLSATPSLRRAA